MARGPATFRQRDLAAAIKAVLAAGRDVVRVEIDKTGKIVVWTGNPCHPVIVTEGADDANEWDAAK
jgi:hypothetical protein